MLRRVAPLLLLLLLAPARALAVETVRIAMGEASSEVRVSGPGLASGPDLEEGESTPLQLPVATVRRRNGRLELNGAPVLGEAIRFRARSGSEAAGAPAGAAPLRANGTQVRGDVVVRLLKGRLQLINVIPLEDYLAAVLGSEMPVSFPLEALKAQAVAARTYALQRKLATYGAPYHLGSSVLHQVYGGLHRENERTREAVLATRGEVLTYELAPIEAYFHASCGGRTESGAAALSSPKPYLQPASCPCDSLPNTRWSLTLSDSELRSALGHPPQGLQIAARTATGRVSRVATASGASVGAVELRRKLGYERLRSLSFYLERAPGGWRFSGRGHGHGAGLCQWGAKVLAEQGRSYRDILLHYYPDTELQQLY